MTELHTAKIVEPLGTLQRVRLESPLGLVEILPERGALVSRWRVGDEELLYLDESTVLDSLKNVRGGVPLLWPVAGRIPGNRYEALGRSFAMRQHGFARERAWTVIERSAGPDGAYVTMRLVDDESSLALYPWPFEARLTVRLQGSAVSFALEVENRGVESMPHAPGFHPYFAVPESSKERLRVETDASWAIDQRTGNPFALGDPDFTAEELDLHLQDHALPGTLIRRPGQRPIRLEWIDGFDALVLWTLRGKDFICVEPWAAVAGSFPAGEAVRMIAPGETDRLMWTMSI